MCALALAFVVAGLLSAPARDSTTSAWAQEDASPAAVAGLASQFPADSILYVEVPDLAALVRRAALLDERENEDEGARERETTLEMEEYWAVTLDALAATYGLAVGEGDDATGRFLRERLGRTESIAAALLDVGSSFARWAVCLRESAASAPEGSAVGEADAAWFEALAAIAQRHDRVSGFAVGDARGFVIDLPSTDGQPRPSLPVAPGLPALPLPWPDLRVCVAFRAHDGIADCWIANDERSLRRVLLGIAGMAEDWQSIDELPAYQRDIVDAPRDEAQLGHAFVDGANLLALLDRALGPRDQPAYARLKTLLELDSLQSLKFRGAIALDRTAGWLDATLRQGPPTDEPRDDGDDRNSDEDDDDGAAAVRGLARLAIAPAELRALACLPASTSAVVAFALSDDPLAVFNRLRDFLVQAAGEDAQGRDGAAARWTEATGVPLEDFIAPLGASAAVALVAGSDKAIAGIIEGVGRGDAPATGAGAWLVEIADDAAWARVWGQLQHPKTAPAMRWFDAENSGTIRLRDVDVTIGNIRLWPGFDDDIDALPPGQFGPCAARLPGWFCFTQTAAEMDEILAALTGVGPRLADSPRLGPLVERLPREMSKVMLADVGALLASFAPAYAEDPTLSALIDGLAVGMASVERLAFADDGAAPAPQWLAMVTAPDLRARLRDAVREARQGARVRACRANLEELGRAIEEYRFYAAEYPPSLTRLDELGQFPLETLGRSPLEVIELERADLSDREREYRLERLMSYTYEPPPTRLARRLDPEEDPPWQAPVHAVPIAWTTRPVWRGGHHVLMSNGSVHWLAPSSLRYLRQLVEEGRTLADVLDDED